jgi:hypothetical protein
MNRFFENSTSTTAIVYLLLLVFLFLRIGGAVSHYCFDGMEPPVTIHFDNLSGHVEHDEEAGHNDMEKQVLSDNLHSKFFDSDTLLFLTTLFLFSLLYQPGAQLYQLLPSRKSNAPNYYLPPLRAPPSYS